MLYNVFAFGPGQKHADWFILGCDLDSAAQTVTEAIEGELGAATARFLLRHAPSTITLDEGTTLQFTADEED